MFGRVNGKKTGLVEIEVRGNGGSRYYWGPFRPVVRRWVGGWVGGR